jgi:alpha-galactosidase
VLFTVQVGGHVATLRDFEIPARYGIRATIADTLGIGGVFRALRTFPVICDTAREMTELCPHAWLFNYTNPMAMLCWSVYAGTEVDRVVGLCHSVQGTARTLARLLEVDEDELDYDVAGVNHQAFFIELATRSGEDLYPRLRDAIDADPDGLGRTVRAELCRRFGYFTTESSEHAAEYVSWFLGDPEQLEHFRVPLDEYLRRSESNAAEFERTSARVAQGEELALAPGDEYAPRVIRALETGSPFRFNGNVRNRGLIENLPEDACVEVPCTADGDGIRPRRVGALPPQLAALNRSYLNVCELAVRAFLEEQRDWVYHACAVDPGISGQAVSLDRIWAACDELFAAHGELIPAALRTHC